MYAKRPNGPVPWQKGPMKKNKWKCCLVKIYWCLLHLLFVVVTYGFSHSNGCVIY